MILYFAFSKTHAFDSAVLRYQRKKEKRTSTVAYTISPSCNSNSGLGLTITKELPDRWLMSAAKNEYNNLYYENTFN